MQYNNAIHQCNTAMQYSNAIQQSNTAMQYNNAIPQCNTTVQYNNENTAMQYNNSIEQCNTAVQYNQMSIPKKLLLDKGFTLIFCVLIFYAFLDFYNRNEFIGGLNQEIPLIRP